MKRKVQKIVAVVMALTGYYVIVLFAGQKCLYLYPDMRYLSPKDIMAEDFLEQPFRAADGKMIMSWFAPGKPNQPVVLFFHGNTGQIATFVPQMKSFIAAGYGVMMVEYRGFANTIGRFRQDKIYADAVSAYDYLQLKERRRQIIVYGYSMGTAPALYLAAMRDVKGLVLAAPFYSLKKIVSDKKIPLGKLLLTDEFPSYQFIGHYKEKLLILFGEKDSLISPKHGKLLFQLSPAKHKEFHLIPGMGHNELYFDGKANDDVLNWLNRWF